MCMVWIFHDTCHCVRQGASLHSASLRGADFNEDKNLFCVNRPINMKELLLLSHRRNRCVSAQCTLLKAERTRCAGEMWVSRLLSQQMKISMTLNSIVWIHCLFLLSDSLIICADHGPGLLLVSVCNYLTL